MVAEKINLDLQATLGSLGNAQDSQSRALSSESPRTRLLLDSVSEVCLSTQDTKSHNSPLIVFYSRQPQPSVPDVM